MSSDPPHYSVREFTPNVIEPSFGLGRILYVLLEHSFWSREQDVERGVRLPLRLDPAPSPCSPRFFSIGLQVLSLPAVVAPTKVLIVPLSAKPEFDPLIREVCKCITTAVHRRGHAISLASLASPTLTSLDWPKRPSCGRRVSSLVLTIPTRLSASDTHGTTN